MRKTAARVRCHGRVDKMTSGEEVSLSGGRDETVAKLKDAAMAMLLGYSGTELVELHGRVLDVAERLPVAREERVEAMMAAREAGVPWSAVAEAAGVSVNHASAVLKNARDRGVAG